MLLFYGEDLIVVESCGELVFERSVCGGGVRLDLEREGEGSLWFLLGLMLVVVYGECYGLFMLIGGYCYD